MARYRTVYFAHVQSKLEDGILGSSATLEPLAVSQRAVSRYPSHLLYHDIPVLNIRQHSFKTFQFSYYTIFTNQQHNYRIKQEVEYI